jgi:hypothetical protein
MKPWAMAAVPIKPEYGPTLGRMLEPRWRAAGRPTRAAVIAGVAALVLLAVVLVLQLLSSTYAHGGRVPFAFKYKGLYRAAPDPGAYVKIQSLDAAGAPRYSYEVYPLTLAPYAGSPSGALPIYASAYIARLRARSQAFVLRGEGKTRVNTVPGYQVLYTELLDGREMFGRDVLLVPPREGAREGVVIAMLNAADATREVKAPSEVASLGVLLRPLKTFTFG